MLGVGHDPADKGTVVKGKRVRKPEPFNWTESCQCAYDDLKEALTEEIMLSHPDLKDPNAHFVMMTDASRIAAGAVLMQ